MAKQSLTKTLAEVFDVLFVLILCFMTLFTTMLARGKVLDASGSPQGMDYSFSWRLLFVTALILGLYFFYVLTHSDKELRTMITNLYDVKQNKSE